MKILMIALFTLSYSFASAEIWGGAGISIEENEGAAFVQFYCGHGEVEKGWTAIDGRIRADGYVKSYQGVGPGPDIPAVFSAQLDDRTMNLTITTEESTRQYLLTRGLRVEIEGCNIP